MAINVMAKKKKISTGFTLIEMMVVVIVFSLMIGTASGVFVSVDSDAFSCIVLGCGACADFDLCWNLLFGN